MTSSYSISPDLRKLGPRIDIKIKPSSALLNSLTNPEDIAKYSKVFSANMLIDTGASCSVIDKAIAPFLGLITHGESPAMTPGGETKHETYDVDLQFFGNGHTIKNLRVMEAEFKKRQGHDGLLGRDVLMSGILIYQGGANQYTLSF